MSDSFNQNSRVFASSPRRTAASRPPCCPPPARQGTRPAQHVAHTREGRHTGVSSVGQTPLGARKWGIAVCVHSAHLDSVCKCDEAVHLGGVVLNQHLGTRGREELELVAPTNKEPARLRARSPSWGAARRTWCGMRSPGAWSMRCWRASSSRRARRKATVLVCAGPLRGTQVAAAPAHSSRELLQEGSRAAGRARPLRPRSRARRRRGTYGFGKGPN